MFTCFYLEIAAMTHIYIDMRFSKSSSKLKRTSENSSLRALKLLLFYVHYEIMIIMIINIIFLLPAVKHFSSRPKPV